MNNKDLKTAIELLTEIIINHADPDCAEYNECDKPHEECMWCGNAKEWIKKAQLEISGVK